jgi:hypothetical protein
LEGLPAALLDVAVFVAGMAQCAQREPLPFIRVVGETETDAALRRFVNPVTP